MSKLNTEQLREVTDILRSDSRANQALQALLRHYEATDTAHLVVADLGQVPRLQARIELARTLASVVKER